MRVDGQLQGAQFEELSSASPTPAARSRFYSDISSAADPVPRFYNSTRWVPIELRSKRRVTVSTTATLAADTEYLECNASGGAFTVTLPAAAGVSGQVYYIRKILSDTTFNAVTIDGNGAEQIDGSNTITLNTRGEWVKIMSLGTSWTVLESGYYEGKTAWTPTGSWVANSTYTGYWWRSGNRINFEGNIALSGAPTSASLTITLMTGVVIDTANMTASAAGVTPFLSRVTCFDAAPESYDGAVYYNSTTTLAIKKDDGDGTISAVTQAAPFTFATGDSVQWSVRDIPVVGWRG